jgi:hypothetical protein
MIARLPGSSSRTALAHQIASDSRWPGINARAGDQCIVWQRPDHLAVTADAVGGHTPVPDALIPGIAPTGHPVADRTS